jgi:hypothetical protein
VLCAGEMPKRVVFTDTAQKEALKELVSETNRTLYEDIHEYNLHGKK